MNLDPHKKNISFLFPYIAARKNSHARFPYTQNYVFIFISPVSSRSVIINFSV